MQKLQNILHRVFITAILSLCVAAQAKDDKDGKGGKKPDGGNPQVTAPAAASSIGWPPLTQAQVDALVAQATTKTGNRPPMELCTQIVAAAQHAPDGTINFVCLRPEGSVTRYAAYNLYLTPARQMDSRKGVCRFVMDMHVCRFHGMYD